VTSVTAAAEKKIQVSLSYLDAVYLSRNSTVYYLLKAGIAEPEKTPVSK
jgi:hypothetical protein